LKPYSDEYKEAELMYMMNQVDKCVNDEAQKDKYTFYSFLGGVFITAVAFSTAILIGRR
jgi:hypothetical protein